MYDNNCMYSFAWKHEFNCDNCVQKPQFREVLQTERHVLVFMKCCQLTHLMIKYKQVIACLTVLGDCSILSWIILWHENTH